MYVHTLSVKLIKIMQIGFVIDECLSGGFFLVFLHMQ